MLALAQAGPPKIASAAPGAVTCTDILDQALTRRPLLIQRHTHQPAEKPRQQPALVFTCDYVQHKYAFAGKCTACLLHVHLLYRCLFNCPRCTFPGRGANRGHCRSGSRYFECFRNRFFTAPLLPAAGGGPVVPPPPVEDYIAVEGEFEDEYVDGISSVYGSGVGIDFATEERWCARCSFRHLPVAVSSLSTS